MSLSYSGSATSVNNIGRSEPECSIQVFNGYSEFKYPFLCNLFKSYSKSAHNSLSSFLPGVQKINSSCPANTPLIFVLVFVMMTTKAIQLLYFHPQANQQTRQWNSTARPHPLGACGRAVLSYQPMKRGGK